MEPVNAGGDTLFAIQAPAGRHITRFAVYNGPSFADDPTNLGSFGSLDDITFTVVTEPSAMLLLLGSTVVGIMLAGRQRRARR